MSLSSLTVSFKWTFLVSATIIVTVCRGILMSLKVKLSDFPQILSAASKINKTLQCFPSPWDILLENKSHFGC